MQYLGATSVQQLKQRLNIQAGDDVAPMWEMVNVLKRKVSSMHCVFGA
jgi:hypothetical protein